MVYELDVNEKGRAASCNAIRRTGPASVRGVRVGDGDHGAQSRITSIGYLCTFA